MGWLKNLFRKEEVKEPIVEKEIEPIIQQTDNYGPKIEECFDCKQPIETYQKRRSWGGHVYHKECLRKLIKKAKQYINQ